MVESKSDAARNVFNARSEISARCDPKYFNKLAAGSE